MAVVSAVFIAAFGGAASVLVDDSTFNWDLQNSFIVPHDAEIVTAKGLLLRAAEDIAIFGNLTLQGPSQLIASDDLIVAGNISASSGDIKLSAQGTIEIRGTIRGAPGNDITLESSHRVVIGGVVVAANAESAGQKGGSLTVTSNGEVSILGSVAAGHGHYGTSRSSSSSVTGDPGGDGGDIIITAGTRVIITQGTLAPGDGGAGGSAIAPDATAGDGGASGRIFIDAQEHHYERASLLPARGGNGGSAVSVGDYTTLASGGQGGTGQASEVRLGGNSTLLGAGSWNLSWDAAGMEIENYTMIEYGASTSPTDTEAEPIVSAPSTPLLNVNLAVESTHPTVAATVSKCLVALHTSHFRPPTRLVEGGYGGSACAEGIPGPNGQNGADGSDSSSALDSCSDGSSGVAPAAAGETGGAAFGGAGGFSAVGIGGRGGDAFSFGGDGGRGGNGGQGGDGYGTQNGCTGGDAAPGGSGGPGGAAAGGHSGTFLCGYPATVGGAASVGGSGGSPGEPGLGGSGGALGNEGLTGDFSTEGERGGYQEGYSGLYDDPLLNGGCLSFSTATLSSGTTFISPDGLPDAIVPALGNVDFRETVSGTLQHDLYAHNDTVISRTSLRGSEITSAFNAEVLLDRSNPTIESLVDLNGTTTVVTSLEGSFWKLLQPFNEEGWWDWVFWSLPRAGGLTPQGLLHYEFISDMWTKEVRCASTESLSTTPEAMINFLRNTESENPCHNDEEILWKPKLPLTNEFVDNQDPVETSLFYGFLAMGWESGCDGNERWISYKLSRDGETIWRKADLSMIFDLSWEYCGDQEHMRFYFVSEFHAFGQAHLEHFHWKKCGGTYHCLHDIEDTSNSAAGNLWAFDGSDWSWVTDKFCSDSLRGEWAIHKDESMGTFTSDGCLHYNSR